MLTKMEYTELLQFRDKPVATPEGPTPLTSYLAEAGYIRASNLKTLNVLNSLPVEWELTAKGRVALQEYEEDRQKTWRGRAFEAFLVILGGAIALLAERVIGLFG